MSYLTNQRKASFTSLNVIYGNLSKKSKKYFSDLIEDTYGSSELLVRILDLGIEMLFYLEEDTFDRKEVQNVVSAIRGIINTLRNEKRNSKSI